MVAKQTTVQSQEQKHALMKPNDLAKTTPPYIYPIPWHGKCVEHRNILLTTAKAWYMKAVRLIKTPHQFCYMSIDTEIFGTFLALDLEVFCSRCYVALFDNKRQAAVLSLCPLN